jgi:type VI secretion system protein ImpH
VSSGHRGAEAALTRQILEHGCRFGFYQLLTLLERFLVDAPRLGHAGPYARERVRLLPHAWLSFGASDVQHVTREDELDAPWKVRVNFMGLYGTAAPTPTYLTELLCATDIDGEPLADFLDLINHRVLSLLYRAWLKYRFPYRYEPGGADRCSYFARSFAGLGDESLCRRTGVDSATILRYLGLLCVRSRPPVGLRLMLADSFAGLEVHVQEWMPRWIAIPEEQRNRIGERACRLGEDLCVGERVLDVANTFRVGLGPLHYPEYESLLPDSEGFARLCALTRLWVADSLDYDVEMTVRGEEIPPMRLDSEQPRRLGWTTWLVSSEGLPEDAKVVLRKRPVAAIC